MNNGDAFPAVAQMLHRSTGKEHEPPPVLFRWAGGKQRLIARLARLVPSDYQERTYREPFLGAASLYFSLLPRQAVLSDANPHLMHCYAAIRQNSKAVSRALRSLAKSNGSRTYYRVRDQYISSRPSSAQAARFIYLNRTCFNGIFRVNQLGQFNVPYGNLKRPIFPTHAHLTRIGTAMNRAKLRACDYAAALRSAKDGDFVYLDPPYPALNGTSFFSHYTPERFGLSDQKALAALVRDLDARGCLIMLTNADTRAIRRLYQGFSILRMPVTRFVSCKSRKHKVGELVVTNYEVPS